MIQLLGTGVYSKLVRAVLIIVEASVNQEYIDYYKEFLISVRRHTLGCLFNPGVSLMKKEISIGTCISPWLMAKLYICRRYQYLLI